MHPTSEMMSKCRKWHLREPKFAKFHGGACPQTPLEARAFGARVSASGAKIYLPKHNRTPLNRIHPTGLWAIALVKGNREPHEAKKKSFDLGGNRTHDLRIRYTVTLATELQGRTEKFLCTTL